jgi:divalent metal cation (Fe/Co/Zn/Cd) transporter
VKADAWHHSGAGGTAHRANRPGVRGLDKCQVRKMGFHYYVDLHVRVEGHRSVAEGHRIAHKVKNAILGHESQDCRSFGAYRTGSGQPCLG